MTQKTADLQKSVEQAELSDDEAKDFYRRLDEFRDSLPDSEKPILAQMVVEAAGIQPSEEQAQGAEPSENDVDSFMEKLDSFHDELPGDQHLFVDEMLAKTWFHDEAEVQGYNHGWVQLGRWQLITNQQVGAYQRWCYDVRGGDKVKFRWYRGGGHKLVACFGPRR